jgi:hypothetical protein
LLLLGDGGRSGDSRNLVFNQRGLNIERKRKRSDDDDD